ncbi:MAG: hypothetical protein Q7R83_01535 [bacterium]|nr:hypothetical protein [bacterium]
MTNEGPRVSVNESLKEGEVQFKFPVPVGRERELAMEGVAAHLFGAKHGFAFRRGADGLSVIVSAGTTERAQQFGIHWLEFLSRKDPAFASFVFGYAHDHLTIATPEEADHAQRILMAAVCREAQAHFEEKYQALFANVSEENLYSVLNDLWERELAVWLGMRLKAHGIDIFEKSQRHLLDLLKDMFKEVLVERIERKSMS